MDSFSLSPLSSTTGPAPDLTTSQYAQMGIAGAFGSALGLLSGLLSAAVVGVAASGCIDCGSQSSALEYGLLGLGSTIGTTAAVVFIAEDPVLLGFWDGVSEISGSPLFGSALLGAAAGIGTGAALGAFVDRVVPSDDPYDLVAYNVGQAATSVLAVWLWNRGRSSEPVNP